MVMPTRRSVLKQGTAIIAMSSFFSACGPKSATPEGSSGFVDGVGIAEQISKGEITAAEAVEAAISRAEAINPKINAFAYEGFAAAREQVADLPEGALSGVPTVMKDLMDWKGMPTLFGSRAFVGNIAQADGPFSTSWRGHGLVSLGKSTSPEMGLISSTEPLVTGPTRNPWDTNRKPGGSSGGAAAITASGIVPFAHASDGGGSIRIPASVCGLVGLKPSRGALPTGRPLPPGTPVDISVDLAVTRTVRDTAALYAATAISDTAPVTEPGKERLRIAYWNSAMIDDGRSVDPEVAASIQSVAELCGSLGHTVVEEKMDFDWQQFEQDFLLYWAAGAGAFAQLASEVSGKPIGPDIVEPWTLGLAGLAQQNAAEIPASVARLLAFSSFYDQWFGENNFDLVLMPTVSRPADPIGDQSPTRDFDELMQTVTSFAAFTAPMNVSGAASISLPLGQSSGGLPIGSMFSGRQGDDRKLIALAYELEEASPWIDRTPPVWAFE